MLEGKQEREKKLLSKMKSNVKWVVLDNSNKENVWMRISKLVSIFEKTNNNKNVNKKENHEMITTATNCYCSMVLAQCVRMKQKRENK